MASFKCLSRLKLMVSPSVRPLAVMARLGNRQLREETRNYSLIGTKNEFLVQRLALVSFTRNKFKKSSSSRDEDSDEEEDDDIDEFDKKTTVKIKVQSLRADLLLKSGVGIARNKIETAFYENRIRINGKKIAKKSQTCKVGDEIDLIKNECPTNPNHLIIARIEILGTDPKDEHISVTMRRFKSLTVEKYDN